MSAAWDLIAGLVAGPRHVTDQQALKQLVKPYLGEAGLVASAAGLAGVGRYRGLDFPAQGGECEVSLWTGFAQLPEQLLHQQFKHAEAGADHQERVIGHVGDADPIPPARQEAAE